MSFCSGGKYLGNMVVIDSTLTYGSWLGVWESNAEIYVMYSQSFKPVPNRKVKNVSVTRIE